MYVKLFVVTIMMFMAVISDYKFFKIKNIITYSFIIIGLILNFFQGRIISSLLGTFLPFISLYILYYFNFLGAGDIKLFCAIGALMGSHFVFYTMIFSFLAGGFISFILLIMANRLVVPIIEVKKYIKYFFLTGKFLGLYNDDKNIKIHFSYSIIMGIFITLLNTF